jgi:hypothetical protein
MGADKNTNTNTKEHGHFCRRCGYHWRCWRAKCLKLRRGFWETVPEKVDVDGCAFCSRLSDKAAADVRSSVVTYHFGDNDERVAAALSRDRGGRRD